MFNVDKRILYIIIAIFAVSTIVQYIQNPMELLALLLTLPGVIVAITFHEFAHAFVADKLGDDTPRRQGRLNLNPLSHIDPVGFFMLIFAHFGWGKPVEINPTNFNRKRSMSAQEAIVALAGPVMNLIIAIVLTIILFAINAFASTFVFTTVGMLICLTLQMAISVNIGLGVFNLIPLPPLDGSKVILPFLPQKAKNWFVNNEQIFYIVFVVLWITNLAGYIITPAITGVSSGILGLAKLIFRLG